MVWKELALGASVALSAGLAAYLTNEYHKQKEPDPLDQRYKIATAVEASMLLSMDEETENANIEPLHKERLKVLKEQVMDPIAKERKLRYLLTGK